MSETMIEAQPDAELRGPTSMMALRKIRRMLIVEGGRLLGIVGGILLLRLSVWIGR